MAETTEKKQSSRSTKIGRVTSTKMSKTIVVQVIKNPNGNTPLLKINQEDTNWDGLQARLTAIFASRAEKIMFVKGDTDLNFADVAQVIDIAHASGVDKVGLITAKIEQGG